ncbi:MAG: hypothetical protein WCT03_09485 [Candidatus Obscuribacterales bacterium]|jgi:hypothetical protein
MNQGTGWLAGIGVGLVALILVGGFAGPLFGVLGAGLAGYYTYKYFDDKYQVQLNAMLNPPVEYWPLRMEEAWLCLEEVLDTCTMQTGVSGVSHWRVTSKDNNRGILKAQIDFKQALGSPADPKIFPRTVIMDAELTPEEDSTKVEIKYNIHSPSGNGMVTDLIKTTQGSLRNRVAIAKEA